MEPRFNEVLRDLENWFVISRVRYIEGSLYRKPRFNEFAEKQPCSLYLGMVNRFFFVVSGSSIESLVSIIIFDHRTWQRTQDYWLQEQTCELGSLSADDTGTTTPLSNSLLKIEVVLSTSVRSFFCQISSIGISVWYWGVLSNWGRTTTNWLGHWKGPVQFWMLLERHVTCQTFMPKLTVQVPKIWETSLPR